MVLPVNNLNTGELSYSGDVSRGLSYILDTGSIDRLLDNCTTARILTAPLQTHPETEKLLRPSPLLQVSTKAQAAPAPSPNTTLAQLDYDIPNGHFYTQANGQGGVGGTGFAVVDDETAAMWTEFQKDGGVRVLGYPISQRYLMGDGLTYQAFQKAILQWNPNDKTALFANVFDELSAIGRDGWLTTFKQTPPSQDWSSDKGQQWETILSNHMALLNQNLSLKNAYLSDPIAVDHYGLPMSYNDYGNVAVLRCQRAVFQQWKVATQFATTNQVLIANGGDNAKDAGLIPSSATTPVQPPPPVLSPVQPGSAGAQLGDAALSHRLGQ
jgi:hypothetical protein